jgi:hypothetical protein
MVFFLSSLSNSFCIFRSFSRSGFFFQNRSEGFPEVLKSRESNHGISATGFSGNNLLSDSDLLTSFISLKAGGGQKEPPPAGAS